jgi:hypothetical protein
METISRCSRCLLPSNLEGIILDDQGICNYCRNYDKDFGNWEEIKDRKKSEFEEILEKAKKLHRPYDCLVPLSGGKDSTYALYLASKVYKLRTLAVTLDNGHLSRLAKENIENALKLCDADHVFYHINRNNTSVLFSEFLQKTGDFCNACMRGINYSIEVSVRSFRIPLVIKGSGRRVQYISQIKQLETLNTPSYIGRVLKDSPNRLKFNYLAKDKNILEIQKIVGGLADILGIHRSALMRFMPQHIGMYDYIYLPYTEIIPIIKTEMGWNDYDGVAEHLDCDLHDIPFYRNTLIVPGITKSTFHNSGLLRQNIITPEEAREREKEDGDIDIPEDLKAFLADNGISYSEYINAVLHSDNKRYKNRIQLLARRIYHRLRKF